MLPKKNRLGKSDFSFLKKAKKRVFSFPDFRITVCKSEFFSSPARFGVVIPAAVSKKAVLRNKLRRRIKNILFKNISEFSEGLIVVVYPQKSAAIISFKETNEEFARFIKEFHGHKN
ncbi:MAG: ribonuclease P protein component [Candidatus Pacebacteria bacterium]|nr:ribonuclease P protein component [Candidatus Paceibacterota bacterium]